MSSSHRDDSLLYDHDFDAEDTARRCEEAVHCRAARAAMVWAINGVVSEGRGGALGGPR